MPTGGAITGAEHLFFFPCKGHPRGLVSRPESPLSRGIIRPTRVLSYHRHDETPRTAAPVAPLRRPSSLSVSASRSLSPQPGRCEALEREREGEGEFERCRESDAPHRNHEPKRTDEKPRRGGRSVAWASLDRVPLALQHRPPCRSAGSRGASPVRGMFTERSRQPTQRCADTRRSAAAAAPPCRLFLLPSAKAEQGLAERRRLGDRAPGRLGALPRLLSEACREHALHLAGVVAPREGRPARGLPAGGLTERSIGKEDVPARSLPPGASAAGRPDTSAARAGLPEGCAPAHKGEGGARRFCEPLYPFGGRQNPTAGSTASSPRPGS